MVPPGAPLLFSESQIQARVSELGRWISGDYRGIAGEHPLHLVGVMKGALFFLADLARAIELSVEIDVVRAASYGDSTESSGRVHILKGAEPAVTGRHVILVEDVVDSGHTAVALLEWLQALRPASLRLAALLDKRSRREVRVPIDYLGFEAPGEFLVGYGLDLAEKYRNLRDIRILAEAR